MRLYPNRLPDDDRHRCKYREDRDEARAEVERLNEIIDAAIEDSNAQVDATIAVAKERDRYREALQTITEEHAPVIDGQGFTDGRSGPACRACGEPDEYAVEWPCQTAQIADAALEDTGRKAAGRSPDQRGPPLS